MARLSKPQAVGTGIMVAGAAAGIAVLVLSQFFGAEFSIFFNALNGIVGIVGAILGVGAIGGLIGWMSGDKDSAGSVDVKGDTLGALHFKMDAAQENASDEYQWCNPFVAKSVNRSEGPTQRQITQDDSLDASQDGPLDASQDGPLDASQDGPLQLTQDLTREDEGLLKIHRQSQSQN